MIFKEKSFIFFSLNKLVFFISIPIIKSFKCEKDGFFPDKNDCWVYHICVGTTHAIKSCKENLLFNPIKSECDWAINVIEIFILINNVFYLLIQVNCTSTSNEYRRPIDGVNILVNDNNNNSSFDYLCQLIDNDYVAHPTDCKQYAYCANGT